MGCGTLKPRIVTKTKGQGEHNRTTSYLCCLEVKPTGGSDFEMELTKGFEPPTL